jgi:hypothetical protein
MDQGAVVSEQTEGGMRLIEELSASGFDVRFAFWAKPTDEGKWFLYLVSPMVDDQGPAAAYRLVLGTLRTKPDLWIDPFEIRVIGLNDSLADAARAATKPKIPNGPFVGQNPRPHSGMTRFNGSTFGGLSIDGAYIYPPMSSDASI